MNRVLCAGPGLQTLLITFCGEVLCDVVNRSVEGQLCLQAKFVHDSACGFDHVTLDTYLAGSSGCCNCSNRDYLRCASLISVFVDDSVATQCFAPTFVQHFDVVPQICEVQGAA